MLPITAEDTTLPEARAASPLPIAAAPVTTPSGDAPQSPRQSQVHSPIQPVDVPPAPPAEADSVPMDEVQP